MQARWAAAIGLVLGLTTAADAKPTCFDAALKVREKVGSSCIWQRTKTYDPVYGRIVWKRSKVCPGNRRSG